MSHWAIIRSNTYDVEEGEEENVVSDPVLCGLYSSKTLAIDEILKLYIEDNTLNYDDDNQDDQTDKTPNDNKVDNTPNDQTHINIEELTVHRERLSSGEIYNTYTHIGNKYTLVECVLDAKHNFSEDVMTVFNKC